MLSVRGKENVQRKTIDLTNQRRGRLTILERLPGRRWKCLCDCGNTCEVDQDLLRRKRPVRSCGCVIGKNRLPDGESALRSLFGAYKKKAGLRGYVFELNLEQFRTLTSSNCWYCNEEPKQIRRAGSDCPATYTYNGIDRYDNTQGYTEENTVPCCKVCNRAKSDMDCTDFVKWVRRIGERFISLFP
jgi:hypothetical protein